MLPGPLQIRLFGGLEVVSGQQRITRFRTRKAASFLAYLAYHADLQHSREVLSELLWPDSDGHASRASLRNELASLRRLLEPPSVPRGTVLWVSGDRIGLMQSAIDTDVARFGALVEIARKGDARARIGALQEAISLYRGDLLSGLYDEWITPERDLLFERHINTLCLLSELLLSIGESPAAREAAMRAVKADFFSARAHAALIRACLALGRPDLALEDYNAYTNALKQEMDEMPEPQLAALVANIRAEGSLSYRAGSRARETLAPDIKLDAGYPKARMPATMTRFFGRESEFRCILAWYAGGERASIPDSRPSSRLLTLIGPGGSGKTRLAVETGRRIADLMQTEVRFVPLVEATRAEQLLPALATCLQLPISPDATLFDRVSSCLNTLSPLLILDNLEQITEAAAELIGRLLNAAPELRVVATSRSRLGLDGEQLLPISPLLVPELNDPQERLVEFASVQLFIDRAQLIRPDFQVTSTSVHDVAALCRKLEGLPLSIELAAGRIGLLTPAQMQQQIERRLDLLISRQHTLAPRHRSMNAAIEWSYALLDQAQQQVFRALAAFRGSWTLEAATALIDTDSLAALGHLETLVEASLVQCDPSVEEMRYSLLETMREFAEDQLDAKERTILWERHGRYYLDKVESGGYGLTTPWPAETIAQLDADRENLRAVLERFLDPVPTRSSSDRELGLRMAVGMFKLCFVRGYTSEGRMWCEKALEVADESTPPLLRAELHFGQALLADLQGDRNAAMVHAEQSIAIRRRCNDLVGLSFTLGIYGKFLRLQGDSEGSHRAYLESISLARSLGDRSLLARTLANYGSMLWHDDDLDAARQAFLETVECARLSGAARAGVVALINLATMEVETGHYAEARWYAEESIREAMSLSDVRYTAIGHHALGMVEMKEGNLEAARSLQKQSLEAFVRIGDLGYIAFGLEWCCQRVELEGDLHRAVRLFAGATALRESHGFSYSPHERRYFEEVKRRLESGIPAPMFRSQWSRGRTMSYQDLLSEAG